MYVCNRYTYPLHTHTNELHPLVIPTTILSGFVARLTYLPATRSTVLLLTPSAEPDQSAAGILSPPTVRMPPPLSARPRRLLLPAGRPCPVPPPPGTAPAPTAPKATLLRPEDTSDAASTGHVRHCSDGTCLNYRIGASPM